MVRDMPRGGRPNVLHLTKSLHVWRQIELVWAKFGVHPIVVDAWIIEHD